MRQCDLFRRFANRNITCHQCFESFGAHETVFVCLNPSCKQTGKKFRGSDPPSRNIPTVAPCPHCTKQSNQRYCPHCDFELSHDAGLIDDRVVAIIGGRATGKSHYIAALINQLEQEVGHGFGMSVRKLGDATRARYEKEFFEPLYIRNSVLRPNQSAQVDAEVKKPLVFRLTFSSGLRRRTLDLSFFDSAGEDMRRLDVMSVEARYITAASAIIFLLDPLQIPAIRALLPSDGLPALNRLDEPRNIVERLCELLEPVAGIGQRIQIPVAFALSKMDALYPIIEAGSLMRLPSGHVNSFNESESRSLDAEIWSYLNSWTGGGLTGIVEANFEKSRYFAVSSLGRSPTVDGRIESVSPLRVEDPFLWILRNFGLVSGTS